MRLAALGLSLLIARLGCGSSPQSEPAKTIADLRAELVGPSVLEQFEVDALPPAAHVSGREISVHGWIAPGSIEQRAEPRTTRFRMVRGKASLAVEYTGVVPDDLRDKLEVVVTGTLSDDGTTLRSESMVAKCPSNYDALPKWPSEGGPS